MQLAFWAASAHFQLMLIFHAPVFLNTFLQGCSQGIHPAVYIGTKDCPDQGRRLCTWLYRNLMRFTIGIVRLTELRTVKQPQIIMDYVVSKFQKVLSTHFFISVNVQE